MVTRYRRAARTGKTAMLEELCAATGYNRKYLIGLLSRPPDPERRPRRRQRRCQYGPDAVRILIAIWEAAGYPWSVRLKAAVPLWLPWAKKRLHDPQANRASAVGQSAHCTIDRRLAAHKKRTAGRKLFGRTKPGTLLKHQYSDPDPGFWQVDLSRAQRRDRPGLPFGQLCGGGVCALAQLRRHRLDLGGDPSRDGQRPMGCSPWPRGDPRRPPFHRCRPRFGQRLGVHQRPPAALLPRPQDSDDALAALQERRQRPHRAEELDPRQAPARMASLRHRRGAGGDQRPLPQRAAADAESLSAQRQAAAQDPARRTLDPSIRSAPRPRWTDCSLCPARTPSSSPSSSSCAGASIPSRSQRPSIPSSLASSTSPPARDVTHSSGATLDLLAPPNAL